MPHHFRILKKLGSGAMGDVCLAFDEHLHRNVALKFPSRTSMGEESHTRLLNEARVASALNHICTIYEVIEVDGRTCIAMEYIEGHPLDEKIPRTGLPPESIVHYGVQISDALEYAHEHGVIHRDLKSSNIVVNDDGCAKVLDFGLAVRHLGAATPQAETQSSTYSANFAGTPQYTAPELFRGSKPDVHTDIWALGVILYEMASGALPFHGETLFELATAIQRDEPAPVSASLPAVIRTVIWRCLAKDPTQRYQHAGEIRAALEVITANRVSASPLVGGLRGGVCLIANVTGLDFIGIPVVTVCRPNSRSISVAQGKGVTPVAAKASGLMESIELYHAEKITLPLKLASYEELRYTHVLVDVDQLPRCAGSLFHPFLQLLWIEGIDLLQDEYVWLPYEMVHTNFTPPLPSGSGCFRLTSSGLASGNHPLEALSHALCELVERDSVTLWALRSEAQHDATRIDLRTVEDPDCRDILSRYERANVSVGVWDATSDVGIPTFICFIGQAVPNPLRPTPCARGSGCHPAREIALLRALTEAAQCRLTYISGSRDDLCRSDYERGRNLGVLLDQQSAFKANGPMRDFRTIATFSGRTFADDVSWELAHLRAAGLERVIAVYLTKPEFDIPVVRVTVPGLEPKHTAKGYTPGRRALAVLNERI